MNFVKGTVANGGQIESPLGLIATAVPNGLSAGASITLAIRPEHVKVTAASELRNRGTLGKIASKNYLGDAALLEVEVNGVTLIAKLAGDYDLAVGHRRWSNCPRIAGMCFLEDGGQPSVVSRSEFSGC